MLVTSTQDETVTGNFEVKLVDSNKLIHSKKTMAGHGKCDTKEQREAIISKIKSALA